MKERKKERFGGLVRVAPSCQLLPLIIRVKRRRKKKGEENEKRGKEVVSQWTCDRETISNYITQ